MTVTGVIPLRYDDCFGEDGKPRHVLSGKPLWEITIGQALDSNKLARVVVAHDDSRFASLLRSVAGRLTLLQRPPELSRPGVTTLDVMAHVARALVADGRADEFFMLLEITHPLRPSGIIDQIAKAAADLDADALVTCHSIHYNFWRQEKNRGAERIAGTGENPAVSLYQELIGICSVFRAINLGTENPFGNNVDIVPIDKFWATIDVRDDDHLWLAEQYLERLGIRL